MSEYIFKLPDLGEGTVESEIGEWMIKVGDQVEEEAVVGTMMTDKAAVELSAPVSGKVVSLAGEPGDMIAVGAPLVVFETDSKAPAAKKAAPKKKAAKSEKKEAPGKQDSNKKVITSPAIRRQAKEAGIDLTTVTGSGTGGRILPTDFERHLKERVETRRPSSPRPAYGGAKEEKVIGLRRVIAERMSEANREVPHFSYVEEVDVTELEDLRQHMNSSRENKSDRLTLLPFISAALIKVLREFPQCNTTFDKNRNVLLRHDAVHLGVATQTPDGLKVPVVKHAESLGLDELAQNIRRLTEAARNNKASRDELTGSTITVTSLGRLGGIASTPVINLPEVAIIGVNKAVERPVIVNGQVAIRRMMNLSSSFDHRFVDGFDAASMVQRLRELLEHPATIFVF